MIERILIISSFFENHVGYQEVQFAETLQSKGYTVKVIATDRSNLDVKKRYENSRSKFEVKRIKKLIRIKNTFYPKENLQNFIKDFSPDLVFLILPGSGIPYFLMKYISSYAKVISVFSDTTIENKIHKARGTKGNKLVFDILKMRWYNKVFERSDLIMANTNETASILKAVSGKNIQSKIRTYGLGFDSNKYFYSKDLRDSFRTELRLKSDQKLIATISRVYAGKPFEFWIDQIKDFLNRNENFVYLLAGFDDTDYSKKVEHTLNISGLSNKLILHKFTSPEDTNKIFNAADFSLWFAPTISIQQSMATGLFAVAPYDSTLDHLIERNLTGLYYSDYDDLRKKLNSIEKLSYNREENSKINQKFSYQNILQKVISEVS
jgi:hypothetical protein